MRGRSFWSYASVTMSMLIFAFLVLMVTMSAARSPDASPFALIMEGFMYVVGFCYALVDLLDVRRKRRNTKPPRVPTQRNEVE